MKNIKTREELNETLTGALPPDVGNTRMSGSKDTETEEGLENLMLYFWEDEDTPPKRGNDVLFSTEYMKELESYLDKKPAVGDTFTVTCNGDTYNIKYVAKERGDKYAGIVGKQPGNKYHLELVSFKKGKK